jgi:uncharacterized protein YjbI with pentapeptide repeats
LGIQRIWYVRKAGEVGGPYPVTILQRHLLLGRLHTDDEVSLDKLAWQRIGEIPEISSLPDAGLDPRHPVKRHWRKERQAAALRWIDERWGPDRRARKEGEQFADIEKRETGDRRQEPEPEAILELRRLHAETELWLGRKRVRYFRFFVGAVLVGAALAMAGIYWFPLRPVQVGLSLGAPNCSADPAPYVNWQGCSKSGASLGGAILRSSNLREAVLNQANLSGADLSYANLESANLQGAIFSAANLNSAVLKQANLSAARLDGADLRYADLTGANLENAVLDLAWLDQATWTDGRICIAGSRGRCR